MEEQALLDSYQFGAESRSLGQFSHPYEQVGALIFVYKQFSNASLYAIF